VVRPARHLAGRHGHGQGTRRVPVATGRITIVAGLRPLPSVALAADRTASVTLPRLTSTTLVTALYSGGNGYAPAVAVGTIRVG
jgi:hypothetical protein